MRAAVFALLAALALSSGARAAPSCSEGCRAKSRGCTATCVKSSKTSEAQMNCRSGCIREDDACRCDCGDQQFCDGGGGGQSGCRLNVASGDDFARFLRRAVAQK